MAKHYGTLTAGDVVQFDNGMGNALVMSASTHYHTNTTTITYRYMGDDVVRTTQHYSAALIKEGTV